MLLSQIEFAAHIGKARSYVTQLKKENRLVMVDGKVDVEASLLKIEETKDPSKSGKENKTSVNYQEVRALNEETKYFLNDVELKQKQSLLVFADSAKAKAADAGTVFRNRMESLPSILAPQLAAERDEHRIFSMMTDHIESYLNDLSHALSQLEKQQ
jgi:hypothetical protein